MDMEVCTVKLHRETKTMLDSYREYRNESYDEVIQKIISIMDLCRKEPRLSRKAIQDIEQARKRITAGNFITESEAKKRLGL
ncbi:MAG: hypothetical protein PHS02_02360 [Candidatus ainarchaeum sp.]|nr:hypothetical protein [Candidatus ainarchaeum sp.]